MTKRIGAGVLTKRFRRTTSAESEDSERPEIHLSFTNGTSFDMKLIKSPRWLGDLLFSASLTFEDGFFPLEGRALDLVLGDNPLLDLS